MLKLMQNISPNQSHQWSNEKSNQPVVQTHEIAGPPVCGYVRTGRRSHSSRQFHKKGRVLSFPFGFRPDAAFVGFKNFFGKIEPNTGTISMQTHAVLYTIEFSKLPFSLPPLLKK